ncbi:hypothetical protein [Culicoidibacter larvae]|uniref:DUF2971 domain-containing protein n=1 Tax=Culicoidibacter larvae TaxID=2579976 RepID=A0A5R8QHB2_9FIRM|nr:hypothetical protein [Culicoidibacter larvae]TLG77388.1 hypothetical protein FEZ08_01855 [Culicoidibacter larvae]
MENKKPEYLYHYTNMASFKSIYDSGTLRLHEHKHLNDYNEIRLFFKLIRRAVEELSEGDVLFKQYYSGKRFYPEISKQQGLDTVDYFEQMIISNDCFNVFILSLSELPDEQVLWNNFAKDYGLNFELSFDFLESKVNSRLADASEWVLPQYFLQKVHYIDTLSDAALTEFLDKWIIVRNYAKVSDFDMQNEHVHLGEKGNLPGYRTGMDALKAFKCTPDCNCAKCDDLVTKAILYDGDEHRNAISTLKTLINDVLFVLTRSTFESYEAFKDNFEARFLNRSSDEQNQLALFKIYTLLSYMGTIKDKFYRGEAEWRIIASYVQEDSAIKYEYYGEQLLTAFVNLAWDADEYITQRVMLSGIYNYMHIDKFIQQEKNLTNYIKDTEISVSISRAFLRK